MAWQCHIGLGECVANMCWIGLAGDPGGGLLWNVDRLPSSFDTVVEVFPKRFVFILNLIQRAPYGFAH